MYDFDTWFDCVKALVAEAGFAFHDADSVRENFDMGESPESVAGDIIKEYS